MDLATVLGLGLGAVIVCVVMIMDGGTPTELFSHPSALLLIFGGAAMATAVTLPIAVTFRLPKLILMVFFQKKYDSTEAIELISRMADKARREGLLALEDESKKIDDPFLRKGIMLVVDGIEPAQVRTILELEIKHMRERHEQGYNFFNQAGGFGPTFGIIGTVMGLISALKELDDPNKLAHAIAGAFLATLWGLLSANLVWLPIGGKLMTNSQHEIAFRHLLQEGILALQSGENPRLIREKLSAFLPPSERKDMQAKPKGGEAKKARAEA